MQTRLLCLYPGETDDNISHRIGTELIDNDVRRVH